MSDLASLDFSHHVRGFVLRRNQANKSYNRLKLVISSLQHSMVAPKLHSNGRSRISDLRAGNEDSLTEEEELQAVQYAQELEAGAEKDREMSKEGETEVLQAWDALAALPIAGAVGVMMKKMIRIKKFRELLFQLLGGVFCRLCSLEKMEGALNYENKEAEKAKLQKIYEKHKKEKKDAEKEKTAEVERKIAEIVADSATKQDKKNQEIEAIKKKSTEEAEAQQLKHTEELNRMRENGKGISRENVENNQRQAAQEFEQYVKQTNWKSAKTVRDQVQMLEQFKARATAAETLTGSQNKVSTNPFIGLFVQTLRDCNFINEEDFKTIPEKGYLSFIVDSYMSLCNARLALGITEDVPYTELNQEIFKKAEETTRKIKSENMELLRLREFYNSHLMDVTE